MTISMKDKSGKSKLDPNFKTLFLLSNTKEKFTAFNQNVPTLDSHLPKVYSSGIKLFALFTMQVFLSKPDKLTKDQFLMV